MRWGPATRMGLALLSLVGELFLPIYKGYYLTRNESYSVSLKKEWYDYH